MEINLKKLGIVVRDDTFDINYKNAKSVGIKLGVYWYSNGKSQKEGEKEALACINIIKGKKFEWPIYVDIEDQFKDGKKAVSNAARGFCNTLLKKKYYCGIYSSSSAFSTHFDDDVKKK